jgi:hypothetical protein
MKFMKILSLAPLALIALMMMAVPASATTLTSPKFTIYTSTLRAENEGPVFLTNAFGWEYKVECNESKFEGKIEKHGPSITAGGTLSSFTLMKCSGESGIFKITKPGSLEFHGTGTPGNATVTLGEAEWTAHETFWGTCTFVIFPGTDVGTLTGSNVTGGKAVLDINIAIKSSCGTTALWEAKYKVTAPSTLEVD